MKRPNNYYTILLLLLSISSFAQAQTSTAFDVLKDRYLLTEELEILEDKNASWSFESVAQQQFTPIAAWSKPSYAVDAYWVKIILKNNLPEELMQTDWLLAFHPLNPDVQVYLPKAGSQDYQMLQIGEHIPYAQRIYKPMGNMSRSCVRVSLPPQQPVLIYAKLTDVRSRCYPIFDLELVSLEHFGTTALNGIIFNGLMTGGLIMMLFFIISLIWHSWRIEYGYYILYLCTILLVELFTTGFDTHIISKQFGLLSNWTESTIWAVKPMFRLFINLSVFLTMMSYLLFVSAFLNLKKLMPKWYNLFRYCNYLLGIICIGAIVLIVQSDYEALLIDQGIAITVVLFLSFSLAFIFELNKKKSKRGQFVILAYIILMVGNFFSTYNTIFQTSISHFSDAILMFAVFSEKLVFTFALSSEQHRVERDLRLKEEEQKQLLQEKHETLEQVYEKTLVAAKAKQDFLAMVSHELRTPMNAIMGFTELLKEYEPTEDQQFCIENLDISNQNMMKMIDNLLHLMDLESENATLEKTPFNLPDLLNNTIHKFQKANENPNLAIELESNKEKLPRQLIGDAIRLKQILENLLSNAVKFTIKGHVALQVTPLKYDEKTATINFKIRDTGIGIPPEKQELIFEAFTQVSDSYNRNFDGLGLGLPLSKRLVELHNSKLVLESEVNEGSIFGFDLIFPLVA